MLGKISSKRKSDRAISESELLESADVSIVEYGREDSISSSEFNEPKVILGLL